MLVLINKVVNAAVDFAPLTWNDMLTYESTWFSKDRMMGKGEVLKAHSAIASITS